MSIKALVLIAGITFFHQPRGLSIATLPNPCLFRHRRICDNDRKEREDLRPDALFRRFEISWYEHCQSGKKWNRVNERLRPL